MKKLVIASDSFKGSLSSLDICNIFKSNLGDKYELRCIPIADGGEGSLESLSNIKQGRFIEVEVKDLYFNNRKCYFFVDNQNNAYIEVASCVGFNLAKENNDPGLVTSFGVGQQIRKAIELGIKNIYVFVGGSATNDGGAGLASALGTKFYNKDNEEFIPTGLTLEDISHLDNSNTINLVKDIQINILSDVTNPLFGIDGAAYTFATQKGANKQEIEVLDRNLQAFSKIIKKELDIDKSNIKGAGAAGGIGFSLLTFANASIYSGASTLLDLIDFDNQIKEVDFVISGEGKLDNQSFDGKLIDIVASRCNKANKKLILIVGCSSFSLEEIQKRYPCVVNLIETNKEHLPFEKIKDKAEEQYIQAISYLSL